MGVVLLGSLAVASVLMIVGALKVFYWVWMKPMKMTKYMKQHGIDGPPYKLFYGNLKEVVMLMMKVRSKPMEPSHAIVPRLLAFENTQIQKYGKLFLSWRGVVPKLNVMEPDMIRDILSNKFGHFSKLMLPAFYACCSDLVGDWENLISKEPCKVDVWPYLQNLTSDVIARTAFGTSYEEGRRIFKLQNEMAELLMQLARSIYIPGFRFLPTKRNNRIKEIYRQVRSVLRNMIKKREEAMKLDVARDDDLLGRLMESNFKEVECGNDKKLGMTIDEVIEECKLFYFAGQETTSTVLVWTMIVLSMHPEWQEKAREEVSQVFGSEKPNFDGLSCLKIISMILNEVLRLYPPVVMLIRKTYKPVKIGELFVPENVELVLPILLIHHDRHIWGKDADEFNLERFSEGILKATKGQVAFFPFGWGPRICTGQGFALVEVKMALVMILQKISFDLSPSYAHAPCTVMTVHPQYGAQLILNKL